MIIRCPECSTGFNLPDERVSEKGVKLRCSRCSHVFRVRAGEGDDVEIYYQDEDNAEEGAEVTSSEDAGEKKLKLPSKGGLSLGGSSSANPFPSAGLSLKPKSASAKVGDDAFEGAFDESSEAEEMEESAAATPAAKFGPPPGVKVAGAPPTAAAAALEDEEPMLGQGTSAFGDPSDFVDDSFGEDGPYFDPNTGKVESPAAPAGPSAGGPPAGARRPGAPVARGAAPAGAASAAAAPARVAVAPASFDGIDDLEPHRIGGSGGSKVVMLLLLVCLVAMGFLGTVAALNGGFLDFKQFGQMIEVAFGDGEYSPREAWAKPTQTTIIQAPEEPLVAESVYGQLVDVGRSDKVLVVRGFVRSYAEESFHNVKLRATVSSAEGRPLREVSGVAGMDVSAAEIAGQKSVADAQGLVAGGGQSVSPKSVVPFTLVIDEVPQTVLDGGSFGLKVSVADQAGGGAPVAAGE
ncbi:hypothetical protein DV096_05080 [Bradymonadaceae bacterium TMQ3]|uniref:Zinc finger/thioredoxin putative domain-containing protein n=1 Tax=Lujinxingia sediminis TaxID=2480984 RepID=A0ABY0CX70_9DELT|nr:zinc-ribbon domain-containing protein [Lujinxingia sediminis]RDV39939.1 hypothetical protein DV096_05080 [Bradymonadaceae bacterium TMQ3]RVU48015.1 hypothetical protein EA187_00855 [Lujinxingia sediminis]TXC77314.1 hypothetical protein FRC91_00860 [Bradymonadales bacterium TMQ1]